MHCSIGFEQSVRFAGVDNFVVERRFDPNHYSADAFFLTYGLISTTVFTWPSGPMTVSLIVTVKAPATSPREI